jgi:hypothetical protein
LLAVNGKSRCRPLAMSNFSDYSDEPPSIGCF